MKRLLISIAFVLLFVGSVGAQVSSLNAKRIYSGTAVPTWNCSPGPTYTDFYLRTTTDVLYFCSAANTWSVFASAGGGAAWGSITGTLSSQTDLQSALDLKAPLASPSFTTTITTPSLTLSGNISSAAWTTNGVRLKGVAATLTDTSSSGTVATAYTNTLGGNTIAASSASTFTNYFTTYFTDPVAGTNVTLTNKWAIGADSLKIGTSNPLTVSTTGVLQLGNGSASAPGLRFTTSATTGIYQQTANSISIAANGTDTIKFLQGEVRVPANGAFEFTDVVNDLTGGNITSTISQSSAGVIRIGTTGSNASGALMAGSYKTGTNCADSAGAAACGSAAAGAVVIDAAATTVVVSTTAVTSTSRIMVTFDSSLGTELGITCNTTPVQPTVSARTAATSFTITVAVAPVTNSACFSYSIIN